MHAFGGTTHLQVLGGEDSRAPGVEALHLLQQGLWSKHCVHARNTQRMTQCMQNRESRESIFISSELIFRLRPSLSTHKLTRSSVARTEHSGIRGDSKHAGTRQTDKQKRGEARRFD